MPTVFLVPIDGWLSRLSNSVTDSVTDSIAFLIVQNCVVIQDMSSRNYPPNLQAAFFFWCRVFTSLTPLVFGAGSCTYDLLVLTRIRFIAQPAAATLQHLALKRPRPRCQCPAPHCTRSMPPGPSPANTHTTLIPPSHSQCSPLAVPCAGQPEGVALLNVTETRFYRSTVLVQQLCVPVPGWLVIPRKAGVLARPDGHAAAAAAAAAANMEECVLVSSKSANAQRHHSNAHCRSVTSTPSRISNANLCSCRLFCCLVRSGVLGRV
jgi:hypothetical protein